MSRKIVLCLDGTGNEIESRESNVLRLYKCLKSDENQIVYYRTGVGTLSTTKIAGDWREAPARLLGMIAGKGLEAHVLEAYRFLCRTWKDGDRIYVFGYSRGAYTARMLAGFINDFGLIPEHQLHLAGSAFRAYRTLEKDSPREAYAVIRMVENCFHTDHPPIRFLGLWDTVNSVMRIRPGGGTILQYGTHSSIDENPSVESVRHVLAIDERRRFFRHQDWAAGQKFQGNRFLKKDDAPDQDVKSVWFSGTHTDVAGSVPEEEAGLAKITLHWMRQQLDALGADKLAFREVFYDRYVMAKEDDVTRRMKLKISAPDATAPIHDKMRNGWFLTEWWPRLRRRSRWPHLKDAGGYYLPMGQRRYIPPNAEIHPSVWERWHADPGYRPVNLKDFTPPAESLPKDRG